MFAYIDDWLIIANSEAEAASRTDEVVSLLEELGWLINREKSSLQPTQSIVYLGARLDFTQGVAFPTTERLLNLYQSVGSILSKPASPARSWLRALGLMASLVEVLELCRLRMRPLQRHLLSLFNPATDTMAVAIPLPGDLKRFLSWWTVHHNVTSGRPFQEIRPRTTVTTDASLSGWGATWENQLASGVWGTEERGVHINVLESLAVLRAIQYWANQLSGHVVTVKSDNSTTVSYINRQGGTRSSSLLKRTWELLMTCEDLGILLKASHLAGKQNVRADALSRLDRGEWTLAQSWVDHLFLLFGRPYVDLFAKADNARLQTFCSR